MLTFQFGSFDGEPVLWKPGEAWVVRDERPGMWSRTYCAEITMHARVLSKAAFDAKFPSLPPFIRSVEAPPLAPA